MKCFRWIASKFGHFGTEILASSVLHPLLALFFLGQIDAIRELYK